MSNPTSARFGVLSYTDHNCPICYNFVRIGARHWCPNPSMSSSGVAILFCADCKVSFSQARGHSCNAAHSRNHIFRNQHFYWCHNPNSTIDFGPLADCPTLTIWGAKPIPVPISTKDRLQRQIEHLRDIYLSGKIEQVPDVAAVLQDLALDL